jgi:hypothetical protein
MMERTIPFTVQWNETFDVAADTDTTADDRGYQVPFRFTARLASDTTLATKKSPALSNAMP